MLIVNLEDPDTRPSFPLQIFPSQVLFARECTQHKLTLKFSVEKKPWFKSWSCHLFNKENSSVCTAGKGNFSIQANVRTASSSRKTCPALHTSKQNLSRRIKLWPKTCSLYTRASKANKELVKENLVVCAGIFCEHLNWRTILKSLG